MEITNASSPEPLPKKGKALVLTEAVSALIERFSFGFKKYGTPLETNNSRDALVDWYQEEVDRFMYATQYFIEEGERREDVKNYLESLKRMAEYTTDYTTKRELRELLEKME